MSVFYSVPSLRLRNTYTSAGMPGLGNWEPIREAVHHFAFCFLSEMTWLCANHKRSHSEEEKVCGAFKRSPVRASAVSPVSFLAKNPEELKRASQRSSNSE